MSKIGFLGYYQSTCKKHSQKGNNFDLLVIAMKVTAESNVE